MARILKNILGGKRFIQYAKSKLSIFVLDQLLTAPLRNKDPRVLPSPEDLKYKVLIRVRKNRLILIDIFFSFDYVE